MYTVQREKQIHAYMYTIPSNSKIFMSICVRKCVCIFAIYRLLPTNTYYVYNCTGQMHLNIVCALCMYNSFSNQLHLRIKRALISQTFLTTDFFCFSMTKFQAKFQKRSVNVYCMLYKIYKPNMLVEYKQIYIPQSCLT